MQRRPACLLTRGTNKPGRFCALAVRSSLMSDSRSNGPGQSAPANQSGGNSSPLDESSKQVEGLIEKGEVDHQRPDALMSEFHRIGTILRDYGDLFGDVGDLLRKQLR